MDTEFSETCPALMVGVAYHRSGIVGAYDDFDSAAEIFDFIENGKEVVKNGKA